jgi:phosphohistidine phosphatase
LGEWLVAEGLSVDRVVASSALRTMQTAELMGSAFTSAPPVEPRDELYLASPSALADALSACGDEVSTLALVGHNPGIWEYAGRLAQRSGQMVGSYSPATCTIFELEGGWSDFAAGTPALIAERRG